MSAKHNRGIIAGAKPAELRFDASTLALCHQLHKEGPVYGCPVCFLDLVYSQPLVDFSYALCKSLLAKSDQLGEELLEAVRQVVADFDNMNNKVLGHMYGKAGDA